MSEKPIRTNAVALGGRAALAVLTALFLSSASFAQDPGQAQDEMAFRLQVEPMYMMVYGHEPHVLDVGKAFYDEEGFSYQEAVNNELDGDFAFRGDMSLMKNQWGLGVTGFFFETEGNLMRRATPEDVDYDNALSSGDLFVVEYESAFVRTGIWNNDGIGIREIGEEWRIGDWANNLDPVWVLDEMVFMADTELDVWTVDFYGIRTLAEKPESKVDLFFGAKIGSLDIDTTTVHGVAIDQYPYDSDDRTYDVEGWVEVTGAALVSQAESDVLAGPYLALSGEARWGRFRVEGLLAQSVLFGDVRQTALGRLIDEAGVDVSEDSLSWGDLPGVDLDDLEYYDRAFEYTYLKDQDVAIPVSEIRIKLLFDLMDNVSLGAGAYAGVWWDAPVPPMVKRGEADLQEDTLVFLGIMGTAELRFFSNAL